MIGGVLHVAYKSNYIVQIQFYLRFNINETYNTTTDSLLRLTIAILRSIDVPFKRYKNKVRAKGTTILFTKTHIKTTIIFHRIR